MVDMTPVEGSLDAKGRCCGRKPIEYKGGSWRSPEKPQRFCSRCDRSWGLTTDDPIPNWAFDVVDGVHVRKRPEKGIELRLLHEPPEAIVRMKQKRGLIAEIIRDVAEIERDPLPGQPDDEMRVTSAELSAILEDRLP